MKFSKFFIDRPIFASVISVLIVLVGLVAYPGLPVAQYPEIAPPTVVVTANYPGASAEVLADTVAAPLEQEINGVEDMIYMTSSSTGDGRLQLSVVFKLGTDLDNAQVLVQNRVASAEARLPDTVRLQGLQTRKNSPDILLVVFLNSPDGSLPLDFVSNYASIYLKDRLARIEGVGGINAFGVRDYAMRIWIDPEKAAARGLNAQDVVNALRAQNVQVAAGTIGAPPFDSGGSGYQLSIETKGRLTTEAEFGAVVIKADGPRITRVSDVARIEIGADNYGTNAYVNGQPGVGFGITQRPGSNALETADAIIAAMEEAKADAMGEWDIFVLARAGRDYFPQEIYRQQAVTYLAGLFRSVRFGVGEAHGQANAIQFNYLMEKGALAFDEATGRFSVDVGVFEKAIEQLVADICEIQARGDYDASAAMIARYGGLPPVLAKALERLHEIPVDIEPVFPRYEP